jgi:hypothetical protein
MVVVGFKRMRFGYTLKRNLASSINTYTYSIMSEKEKKMKKNSEACFFDDDVFRLNKDEIKLK